MPNGTYPPGSGCLGGRPRGGETPGHFPRFLSPPYLSGFPRSRCEGYGLNDRGRNPSRGYGCRNERDLRVSALSPQGGWYGIPGVWDMMPGPDASDRTENI